MYGTVGGVTDLTGVKPQQLGKATQADLDTLLTGWLEDAQSMINGFLDRDLEAEVAAGTLAAIPRLVQNCAERIVTNMVALGIQRRLSPVVQEGEISVQLSNDAVFTKPIKDDLVPLKRTNQRRKPLTISLAGFPDSP